MPAAFTKFTKAQQRSVMPFGDFQGVRVHEIYDEIFMNGVKHLDASYVWSLRASYVWVKAGSLSECHGQPKRNFRN